MSAGNYNIGHAYTANGHEATLTYPDGISVGYAPNALGEQTQAGIYATNVTRHPNGAIATFSYGNGIVHTGNQTDRGLPDLSSDASTSLNVLDDDYDWDENGNVTAIVSGIGAGATRHMQYDARDRLTQTTYNKLGPAQVTFTYDPLDNLRSYSTGTVGRNCVHDYSATTNRLTRIYEQVGSTQTNKYQYGYTGEAGNRGNVTSRAKVSDGTSQLFAFDQGNRMRTLSGTASETYGYDGMRRGARISVAGGISRGQIYSQAGNFVETVSCLPTGRSCNARGSYNATTDYIYLDRHLVASIRVDAPALPKVTYQHTDGLGSPVAETDATGALIASTRTLHEPYGLLVSTALTPSPLRQGPGYTGHVVDAATGLSYMQQRYYDPIAGRFLSMDPVAASAGSFNRYWYANNNPYKFVDPDGRMAWPRGEIPKDCNSRSECRFAFDSEKGESRDKAKGISELSGDQRKSVANAARAYDSEIRRLPDVEVLGRFPGLDNDASSISIWRGQVHNEMVGMWSKAASMYLDQSWVDNVNDSAKNMMIGYGLGKGHKLLGAGWDNFQKIKDANEVGKTSLGYGSPDAVISCSAQAWACTFYVGE